MVCHWVHTWQVFRPKCSARGRQEIKSEEVGVVSGITTGGGKTRFWNAAGRVLTAVIASSLVCHTKQKDISCIKCSLLAHLTVHVCDSV